MRNISFSLTKPQFLAGTKDVTRRMGWENARAGDVLKAVEKCMGLKKGEAMVIIGHIRLLDLRREPLDRLLAGNQHYGRQECIREGFPEMTPAEFVEFFCRTHTGCFPEREITRLEFERIPNSQPGAGMPAIAHSQGATAEGHPAPLASAPSAMPGLDGADAIGLKARGA